MMGGTMMRGGGRGVKQRGNAGIRRAMTSRLLPEKERMKGNNVRSEKMKRSRGKLVARACAAPLVHRAPKEDELICLVKAEIPEQLPRPYLIKDLYQWSVSNLQDDGREQYGLPIAVAPYEDEEDEELSRGFVVSFLRALESGDEETVVDMYVRFDSEVIGVFDGVDKDDTGKPELKYRQGKTTVGKYLEFMRRKDNEIPDDVIDTVKQALRDLNGAIQTYYTFGSCFVDDVT